MTVGAPFRHRLWCFGRRLGREQRGQASVEYGVLTWAILGGLAIGGYPLFLGLLHAVQIYFDSFFLVLRLPIP